LKIAGFIEPAFSTMRFFFLLLFLAFPALADEPTLRPSARLLFKKPELLRPGTCVAYKEGGSGWILTEPVFYLKGVVLAAEVRGRHLKTCPNVPGKNIEQYSREQFNRLSAAFPCLADGLPERDEQIGIVRFKVASWETPHAKQAANKGRLYRGSFIDQTLKKDMEIELEADLLESCTE
jgi:hypothetical protein